MLISCFPSSFLPLSLERREPTITSLPLVDPPKVTLHDEDMPYMEPPYTIQLPPLSATNHSLLMATPVSSVPQNGGPGSNHMGGGGEIVVVSGCSGGGLGEESTIMEMLSTLASGGMESGRGVEVESHGGAATATETIN